MDIGYIRKDYPIIRCVLDKIPQASYTEISSTKDFVSFLLRSMRHMHLIKNSHKVDDRATFTFKCSSPLPVDVIHTFNMCCDTPNKWCVSFESAMPRLHETMSYHRNKKTLVINDTVKKHLEHMAADNCIGLYALSENSLDIHTALINEIGINVKDIIKKSVVLHPPQKLFVSKDDIDTRFNGINDELRIIFIGNALSRKGGVEMINVLYELRKRFDINIKLILISNMSTASDAVSGINAEELESVKALVNRSEWIEWHSSIPNAKVIELCKTAHIGMLPSYADSYGYSVLEMQACGVPVITTDIRAFPEINNSGWRCHIPQNEFKEATGQPTELLRESLVSGLNKTMEDIINNIGTIKEKAYNAITEIRDLHSLDEYAAKLIKLYSK